MNAQQTAVRLRASLAVGGLVPVETEICPLWEFDETGQIR